MAADVDRGISGAIETGRGQDYIRNRAVMPAGGPRRCFCAGTSFQRGWNMKLRSDLILKE
jgi:hypothetical protein